MLQLSTQGQRLGRALAIVGLSLAAIPLSGALASKDSPTEDSVPSEVSLDFSRAIANQGDNPESVLDSLEAQVDSLSDNDGSSGDSGPISIPGEARDVRINRNFNITSYVIDGKEEEVMDNLIKTMEDQGWSAVPLGGVSGATFLRGNDEPWVIATATSVGSSVSVVYREIQP